MQDEITLDMLKTGDFARVIRVECNGELNNRIYALGITENSVINKVFKAPFGDPVAYSVKNTLIALRNKDCKNIIVAPI